MIKWLALGVAALLVILYLNLPTLLEPRFNRVEPHEAYVIQPQARELHQQLTIMDWHSDSLLWERNILDHVSRGHVDVPRLQQGNVALQMFTTVTKSPKGQNYEKNSAASDRITSLVIAQGWPIRTWDSLLQRSLYQAQKLDNAVNQSDGQLRWVRNVPELEELLASRKTAQLKPIGVLLGMEGAHPLEGDIANLDKLYQHGFRMIGLQHFFDNRLGGSLHGLSQSGLTEFGRQVVAKLNDKQMIIDVAHSSAKVVEEVLELSRRPIVVSHTGLYGVCPTARNLPDQLMQQVAAKGGLIALGYWQAAACDISPQGIAKMIKYGIDLVGEDHIALGSDFDGAVETRIDSSEIATLTQELLALNVTKMQIRKVMGENSVKFLQQWLPKA
ncbi:dipeptidase [Neptunicella sp. SCSIO 80796]|uniref:dipeptidase n=1 Tax=Neptunicella plasticusilytica TaxID=3117012 RepID=UPI003A4D989C